MQEKITASAFIEAALVYRGQLENVTGSNDYVSFDYKKGSIANDFNLLFCDSLGIIPKNIKDTVQQRKLALQSQGFPLKPLYMSSWDFCFMALVDAGIISQEMVDNLIFFCFNMNNSSVQALYNTNLKLETYEQLTDKNLPQPGDILLFTNSSHIYPYHTAICISSNEYIELSLEGCVRKGVEEAFNYCVILPFNEIEKNISNFLNRCAINFKDKDISKKLTEAELLKMLRSTRFQYRNCLTFEQLISISCHLTSQLFDNLIARKLISKEEAILSPWLLDDYLDMDDGELNQRISFLIDNEIVSASELIKTTDRKIISNLNVYHCLSNKIVSLQDYLNMAEEDKLAIRTAGSKEELDEIFRKMVLKSVRSKITENTIQLSGTDLVNLIGGTDLVNLIDRPEYTTVNRARHFQPKSNEPKSVRCVKDPCLIL